MKTQLFKSASVAVVAALFLGGVTCSTIADARPGGGGGGGGGGRANAGGGGGGAHAGGGARPAANNSRADSRTNNVRSSSTNNVSNRNTNVNSNRNVNVNTNRNVNVNGGCCGGGWDNDYHPIATAAAVTATVAVTSAVVGSMVRTVPAGCAPVNYGGMIYQQCGGAWYMPQGSQYVVVNAPY